MRRMSWIPLLLLVAACADRSRTERTTADTTVLLPPPTSGPTGERPPEPAVPAPAVEDTAAAAPAGSGPSIEKARAVARDYVETAAPQGSHWTVKEFGPLAPAGTGYRMGATLAEDDNEGMREYTGSFTFTRRRVPPGSRDWTLSSMSFRHAGRAPIERRIDPPIDVPPP